MNVRQAAPTRQAAPVQQAAPDTTDVEACLDGNSSNKNFGGESQLIVVGGTVFKAPVDRERLCNDLLNTGVTAALVSRAAQPLITFWFED